MLTNPSKCVVTIACNGIIDDSAGDRLQRVWLPGVHRQDHGVRGYVKGQRFADFGINEILRGRIGLMQSVTSLSSSSITQSLILAIFRNDTNFIYFRITTTDFRIHQRGILSKTLGFMFPLTRMSNYGYLDVCQVSPRPFSNFPCVITKI